MSAQDELREHFGVRRVPIAMSPDEARRFMERGGAPRDHTGTIAGLILIGFFVITIPIAVWQLLSGVVSRVVPDESATPTYYEVQVPGEGRVKMTAAEKESYERSMRVIDHLMDGGRQ